MRKIEFTEIGMENFGPYIDPMILNIQKNALVLITGPNGVGKTMSLEALPFTLFGTTSKGAKGDDVVNNVVGKNCKTWVKFLENDDEYKITRYHKYTKVQNTVIVNKNGVDIKKGQKEVLPFIEKLICPKKSFVNTLMFGQKVKDFFTDLFDSEKKEIFRKILDLDVYNLYYQQTKDKLKEAIDQITEIETTIKVNEGILQDTNSQIGLLNRQKQNFYTQIENDIKELEKEIENNKRLLKSWETELENLLQISLDVEKLRQKLNDINYELQTNNSKKENLILELDNKKSQKIDEIKSRARNAEIKVQEIFEERYNQLQNQLQTINNTYHKDVDEITKEQHELNLEENSLISNETYLDARIDEITSSVLKSGKNECPTCEQEVSEQAKAILTEKVENHQQEINNIKKKYDLIREKRHDMIKRVEERKEEKDNQTNQLNVDINNAKRERTEELDAIKTKLQDAINKVTHLAETEKQAIQKSIEKDSIELNTTKNEIEKELETQNETLAKQDEAKSKITEIKNNINYIQNELERKKNEEYDDSQIKSYQSRKVSILDENDKLNKDKEQLETHKNIFEFWKKAFSQSGIPSMLIDEAIPFMNKQVAYYLDKITNGRYIVSFDTLEATKKGEFRDKISVNIVDTHTKANSRIQLSGGQTRIIDIATILTLSDLQSNIQDVYFNILLFDEIFDSLDEENIGYVSKVLTYLKKERSIYLISHRHEDQLEADEIFAYH